MTIATVTKKNDVIEAKTGDETIIQNPKSGGTDTIWFKDVSADKLKFSTPADGEDLVITVDGTDTKAVVKNYFSSSTSTSSSVKKIRLGEVGNYVELDILKDGLINSGVSEFAPDKKGVIKGTMFSDTIIGTDGNDKIYTNGGDDVVIGSKGNDSIYAGSGSETFKFSSDAISDGSSKIYNADKNDTLEIDSLFSKRNLVKSGNDLVVNGVTLVDWFKQRAKGNELTKVKYSNDELDLRTSKYAVKMDYSTSTKGQNIQSLKDMDCDILAGSGNDKIYVNAGEDKVTTLQITKGSYFGNKTIYFNNEKGITQLRFVDSKGNPDNGNFYIKNWTYKRDGNDVLITIDAEDSTKGTIRFKDYFSKYHQVRWNGSLLEDNSMAQYYLLRLNATDATKGQVLKGSVYDERIKGSAYNDKIYTGGGNDTVWSSKGNDSIYSGNGSATFKIKEGYSTDDGITKIYNTNKNDTLLFEFDVPDPKFEKIDNDLDINGVVIADFFKKNSAQFGKTLNKVSFNGTEINIDAENLKIMQNYMPENRNQKIYGIDNMRNELIGSNYNDKIYTGGSYKTSAKLPDDFVNEDTVIGGKGNDTIYVGSGENHLIFNEGDGRDTIYMTKAAGNSNLEIDSSNLGYTKNGNDLVIKRDTTLSDKTSDSITIKDYFKQNSEHFSVNDESIKDILNKDAYEAVRSISATKANKAATLNGSLLDDTITGSSKNDKIYTNGGNDIVNAGKGNDTIYVDGGTDPDNKADITLNVQKGDGVDTVYLKNPENIGKLTVKINSEYAKISFEQAKNGKDLILNYISEDSKTVDRIILKDFLKLNQDIQDILSVKYNYRYASGTIEETTDTVDRQGVYLMGDQNKANKLYGENYPYYIMGGNKNDTITVVSGSQTKIDAGKGDDTIILANQNAYGGYKYLDYRTGDGTDTIITKDLHGSVIRIEYSDGNPYKFYQTEDGDLIVGDFGRATRYGGVNKYKDQTDFSFGIGTSSSFEAERTYDITNSKMIFKDFLNQADNFNSISYRNGSSKYAEDFKEDAGMYITKANGTGENAGSFIGSDKADYIITSSKNDTVEAGNGDDIIVINKGTHEIDGGDGWDTVVVKDLSSFNALNGVERLQYNGKLSDLYFAFHVDDNGKRLTTDEGKGIAIGNSSIYGQLMSSKFKSGIWSEDGLLDELIVADKNGLNNQRVDLDNIISVVGKKVGQYLKSKNYSSTLDLMYNARSKKDIDGLMKIYKQGISGNDTLYADYDNYYNLAAGAGNDTYKISKDFYTNMSSQINDSSGKNDTLELVDVEKDDVHIMAYINLKTDKNGNVIRDKKGNVQYTLAENNLKISSDFLEYNGVTINDYFGSGKIENIKYANGKVYNVNARLQEIAKWLADCGFTSMHEAISSNYELVFRYLSGANVIISNNKKETTGTNASEEISVNNTKDDVFTIDLKNGDDELTVAASDKHAKITMGTGFKEIVSWANKTTIDASKADKVFVEGRYRSGDKNETMFDITGSNGDDTISVYEGNASIKAGKGNDVIAFYGRGNADLEGGEGSDTYIVDDISGKLTITDVAGDNDALTFTYTDKNDIHFVFNVKADGTFDDGHDKLYVLNNESYETWKKGESVTNGLTINDFDSIETMKTQKDGDKYYFTTAELNALRESVAGWLAAKGYADVNEVFGAEKNDGDINALIAEFEKANWQN